MRSTPTLVPAFLPALFVASLSVSLASCGDDGTVDTPSARRLDEDFAPDPARKPCGPAGSFVSRLMPERFVGYCDTTRRTVAFSTACVAHDACYSRPDASRAACDTEFRSLLESSCQTTYVGSSCGTALKLCNRLAGEYYVQVRAKGEEAFTRAQAAAASPTPAQSLVVKPTPGG